MDIHITTGHPLLELLLLSWIFLLQSIWTALSSFYSICIIRTRINPQILRFELIKHHFKQLIIPIGILHLKLFLQDPFIRVIFPTYFPNIPWRYIAITTLSHTFCAMSCCCGICAITWIIIILVLLMFLLFLFLWNIICIDITIIIIIIIFLSNNCYRLWIWFDNWIDFALPLRLINWWSLLIITRIPFCFIPQVFWRFSLIRSRNALRMLIKNCILKSINIRNDLHHEFFTAALTKTS